MFSRIQIEGFIINGSTGSLYLNPQEWKVISNSDILKTLIQEGIATYDDLSDPYVLYDKFSFLEDPVFSLNTYLNSITRIPDPIKDKIADGFKSYLMTTDAINYFQ